MRAQAHGLHLVYPPISNQHAQWMEREEEIESAMAKSNLYMIGHRAEARFAAIHFAKETGFFTGVFNVPGLEDCPFAINVGAIVEERDLPTYEVDAGSQHIRIWRVDGDDRTEVADWFTSEKLLYDKARGHPHVLGLERFRELATYDLLYVGISKKGDSFRRLIKRPHAQRARVLSSAHPKKAGARTTDEIVLFFFELRTTFLNAVSPTEDDAARKLLDVTKDKLRTVADAEKALIRVLDPPYNEEKYTNYPRCTDGLYGQGIDAYAYALAEDLTLKTAKRMLRGDRTFPEVGSSVDLISIQGDSLVVIEPDGTREELTRL